MAKPYSDRANANAAAIQAAIDYQSAQLQARGKLAAARQKIMGGLRQAQSDAKYEARQAAADASGTSAQAPPPQEPYPGVPMPDAAQPSQSLQGAGMSFDPSQVSGGGGIQAAAAAQGQGQAGPQAGRGGYAGTGYDVPPTISSAQQTVGTRTFERPEGFYSIPYQQATTETRQNALTPAQALSIYQAGELGKQRLALEAWLDRTTALKNLAMAHKANAGIGEMGGLEMQRIRTAENALRGTWEQESKPFKSSVEAFNQFQTALQEPHNAFRDMKLVYQFIKSQDNSAVKEGEYTLAQSAVGQFPYWSMIFERLKKGQTLLPEESIAELSGLMYGGIRGNITLQKTRDQQYGRIAVGQGLRPDQIVYPLITPELENAANTPVRPNMNPEGVPATAKPILKNVDGSIIYEDPSPFPNMPGQKYKWEPSAEDLRMINGQGPLKSKAGTK